MAKRKPKQEYWYVTFEISEPYNGLVYTRLPIEKFTEEQAEEIEEYARKHILDKYGVVTDDCTEIGTEPPMGYLAGEDDDECGWEPIGEFLE